MAFDEAAIRAQFPVLERNVRLRDGSDAPLTYLDHGASTHAPTPVIDAVNDLMRGRYANIHRGNHTLSRESSDLFDHVYETLAGFVGASLDSHAVVMTQNTTTALDMAAHLMADTPGATLTTLMEHHSNDLPHRSRGKVLHADVDAVGRLDLDDVEAKLQAGGVKLVAVTGASNVTGAMPPIHDIARLAHDHGARILVDAAQLYAHQAIDVKPAGHPEHIDMIAAAGHKAYAPYGGACLIAPRDLLDAAPPYLPGGGTVTWVTDDSAMWAASPDRHMGGTPNIAGAIAFGAATEWLAGIGMDNVRAHEEALIASALRRFAELEDTHSGLRLFGPREVDGKGAVFSFLPGQMAHDAVSATLDAAYGIATRNGCFCAHPLLHRLLDLKDTSQWTEPLSRGEEVPLPGAVRAAVGIYNTQGDLDLFFDALDDILAGRTPLQTEDLQPQESAMLVS